MHLIRAPDPTESAMTGDELRVARHLLGLSQQQLANELGVDKGTISRWERSLTTASFPKLVEQAVLRLLDERGDAPTPMTPEEFRELRLAQGLTQDALSQRLGVTTGAISRWESGQRRIPRDIARQLANP